MGERCSKEREQPGQRCEGSVKYHDVFREL